MRTRRPTQVHCVASRSSRRRRNCDDPGPVEERSQSRRGGRSALSSRVASDCVCRHCRVQGVLVGCHADKSVSAVPVPGGPRGSRGRGGIAGLDNTIMFQYDHTDGTNTGASYTYSVYPCGATNNGFKLTCSSGLLFGPTLDSVFGPGAWASYLAALGHNAADVGEPRTYGLEIAYRL